MKLTTLLCGAALSAALAASGADAAMSAKPSGAATAARGTAFQVSLDQVTNPKGRLAGAAVEDKDGNSVGSVKEVMLDGSDRPIAVRVDVGGFLGVGTKLVALNADNLKYEQDRNILITTLRKSQIEALPAINA